MIYWSNGLAIKRVAALEKSIGSAADECGLAEREEARNTDRIENHLIGITTLESESGYCDRRGE